MFNDSSTRCALSAELPNGRSVLLSGGEARMRRGLATWTELAVDARAGVELTLAIRCERLLTGQQDMAVGYDGRGAACEDAVTSLRPTGSRPAR